VIPEAIDQLRREIAGVMTNPLRIAGVTCAICTREVDSGYQLCFRCRSDRSRFEMPQQFGPPGHLTADLVVPLTYAVSGHQAYLDMHKYKDVVSFEAAQRRLMLLAGLFVLTHDSCIDRITRHPVSGLAVVPSLTGRSGPHPLEMMAQLFPHKWHRIQLTAAPNLPADRNQRREANPAYYQCNCDLSGRHIVLFEDTWVTGGHAQGAAVRLRHAGASRVTVLVLARMLKTDYQPTAEFVRRHNLPHPPYELTICPVTGGACPQ
jgi:predicted amidophosphoribosyltransferase